MVTSEVWKPVVGYEGIYEVSNMGCLRRLSHYVRSKNNGFAFIKQMEIKPTLSGCGYLRVGLARNGEKKLRSVHRLVAEAFISNPLNLPQVNHKDENKENNSVGNLEWCDAKYNTNYGTHNQRVSLNGKNKGGRAVIATNPISGETLYFVTISDAGRYGYKVCSVWAAINRTDKPRNGKCRLYKGYVWRYADGNERRNYINRSA